MSLKRKIILSFLISAIIIAVLAISAFINFIEIKKEIRHLELSDTIRSKSLQLRRHEKNFFLYRDIREIENVHNYLKELKDIIRSEEAAFKTQVDLDKAVHVYKDTVRSEEAAFNAGKLPGLKNKIEEYEQGFNRIEIIVWEFQKQFDALKPLRSQYAFFYPLIESTVLERPLLNAELLKKIFPISQSGPAIKNLEEMDKEIKDLRRNGEDIIVISKDIDKSAREKVERAIRLSEAAAFILLPLSFFAGLCALLTFIHSVVKRLKLLVKAVGRAGRGEFLPLSLPEERDEVGVLVRAFNKMENDLIERETELKKKNEELLRSRKLAAIGTLASGVAHELNNPLNNIYLAAQVLSREIGAEGLPVVRDTVKDIFSQTLRVKLIVSELLEFAREKQPELKKINIAGLIDGVLCQMITGGMMRDLKVGVQCPEDIEVNADSHLLEQVFINLFTNAVDAMGEKGSLDITVNQADSFLKIKVSDTGSGIAPESIPRIFDPFFTTKEKGTGLGLAIVYNIIERHGGRIEVESELNKGTTFTITLPAGQ
jgi:signal transduction histidine kinase